MSQRTNGKYEVVLKLFVSGASPNSLKAIDNLRNICEKYMSVKYNLEIVDVYQDRSLAEREQIFALPLLVKKRPLPERKFIGDMSDTKKLLDGLGLDLDVV